MSQRVSVPDPTSSSRDLDLEFSSSRMVQGVQEVQRSTSCLMGLKKHDYFTDVYYMVDYLVIDYSPALVTEE